MLSRKVTSTILITTGIAWAAGIAASVTHLNRYQTTPGSTAASTAPWPADAPPLSPTGFTLALFLHPECPCSHATVASLDQIAAHANTTARPLRIYVFAEIPNATNANTPLLQTARAIPGTILLPDPAHRWARRLGATTSGHAILFDAHGQRLFSGGITPSRGHEGDNPGTTAIHAILLDHSPLTRETPVFGCTLFNSQ